MSASLLTADHGAQYVVSEPQRASRGGRHHCHVPVPGAEAAVLARRQAALPHLQLLLHGPPRTPGVLQLKTLRATTARYEKPHPALSGHIAIRE